MMTTEDIASELMGFEVVESGNTDADLCKLLDEFGKRYLMYNKLERKWTMLRDEITQTQDSIDDIKKQLDASPNPREYEHLALRNEQKELDDRRREYYGLTIEYNESRTSLNAMTKVILTFKKRNQNEHNATTEYRKELFPRINQTVDIGNA